MKSLTKFKRICLTSGLLALLFCVGFGSAAQAGGYYLGAYRQSNYYPSNPYYAAPVIIEQRVPLVIERTGSNDYLYQYDNIYGSEASAAGRMSSTVVNPPPQLYIRGY